jgi:hypothetical protein
MNSGRPIPLDQIDIFWRTLSVPWPVINRPPPEDGSSCNPGDDDDDDDDDDTSFNDGVRQFKNIFSKSTSFVKKNMLTKLREIFQPESVDTREPAIQKKYPWTSERKGQKGQGYTSPGLE